MTQLDIDANNQRRETGVVSQADRYALLKMLEEKPRAVIARALREAAQRGMFTDKILDVAPASSGAGSALKSTVFGALLLMVGALGYVGSREYASRLPSFTVPLSVMGVAPNDATKTVSKEEEEKNDIAYARLSEPVRNAFKNHLPEAGSGAKPSVNCASAPRPDSGNRTDKIASTQNPPRPPEPANKWIERMTALNNAGKINELETELKKFRLVYPSALLPIVLQALAC